MFPICRPTPRSSASAGAGDPVRAVEDAEREAPDRARHPAAVALELVERLVPVAANVRLGAVDEVAEGLERDREASCGVRDGDEHGLGALGRAQRIGARRGELRKLRVGGERAVRDVVDLASEGVDREQRLAPIRGEKAHAGVEARAGVPGDAAAVLICQLHSAHSRPLA